MPSRLPNGTIVKVNIKSRTYTGAGVGVVQDYYDKTYLVTVATPHAVLCRGISAPWRETQVSCFRRELTVLADDKEIKQEQGIYVEQYGKALAAVPITSTKQFSETLAKLLPLENHGR